MQGGLQAMEEGLEAGKGQRFALHLSHVARQTVLWNGVGQQSVRSLQEVAGSCTW